MRYLLPPLLGALLWIWGIHPPPAAGAQSQEARAAFREGERLAQAGDTTLALASIRRAVELDPAFAEAHFRMGVLHAGLSSGEPREFRERLSARGALERAIRLDPENPLYLLEFGKLLLRQQIRVDAQRVFQRALDLGERADASTQAELHFQLGVFRETQWLRFRERHRFPQGLGPLSEARAVRDPMYVWDVLERSYTFDGQGEADRESMLAHFRAALAANPAHAGAATHLLAYHYEVGALDEFMAEAQRFLAAAPGEWRGYLALGLGLHVLGRQEEAAGSFRYGVELMPPEIRDDFESVARILPRDEAELLESLEGEARAEALRSFWVRMDPLLLTPANEYQVEYVARMAYADLRFGLPEYGIPGWRTDRGDIWVRYGAPERVASFSPTSGGSWEAAHRITTVWSYGRRGPVFFFNQNPGYRQAAFAGDFRSYARELRSVESARFDAPTLASLISVPVQVARFRSDDGVRVEVHAALPLDSLLPGGGGVLDTGVFVLDARGRELHRRVQQEVVVAGSPPVLVRSWVAELPADTPLVVSVEARDPVSWVAAASRERMGGIAFPPGAPSVSDLLLAGEVELRVPGPRRREDFRIRPEPRLTFIPEAPVHLYFELYDLLPDPDGFASYELELSVIVEEIYRQGPLRRLLGELADRWGVSEVGEEAVRLRFRREERVVARDVIPEYLSIVLDEPPPGRYGLSLVIRDRNAGVELVTARSFQILEGEGPAPESPPR